MDSFLDFFTQYYDSFMGQVKFFGELTKDNPVLGGIIGLYGAGILAYVTKEIPGKVIASVKSFIHKQFTISIKISNYEHTLYNSFLKWYEEENFSKKSRTLIAEDTYSGKRQFKIGAGLGNHYFVKNKRIFKLTRSEKELQSSKAVKETIVITTYGRSRKPFEDLMKNCAPDRPTTSNLNVYRWNLKDWEHGYSQKPRGLDTVILGSGIKDNLIKHLKDFSDNENWYMKNGIPYRTGILLEGPGGTGKTSIVRALCSHLNTSLYLINLGVLTDGSFEKAMSSVPKGAVVLIEDIDAFNIQLNREGKGSVAKDIVSEMTGGLSISGILNGIDGIAGSEGRILIATTNHPEKLDKALTRPGRFDLTQHIGYLDNESFVRLFNRYFPKNKIDKIEINNNITPAILQASVLANIKDPIKVLENMKKLNSKEKRVVPYKLIAKVSKSEPLNSTGEF